MNREYLEERLVAFVDGELSTEDEARFEIELKQHPDLMELVERMRKLDKLAKSTGVPMPDEAYFEKLADRIEAKLPEKPPVEAGGAPRKRATIVDFLTANRKLVSIAGSAAAVLLVVLIGVQIFGPGTPQYPKDIRRYEVEPAIDRTKVEKSQSPQPAAPPDTAEEATQGRQIQPVPELEGESDVVTPLLEKSKSGAATDSEGSLTGSAADDSPVQIQVAEPSSGSVSFRKMQPRAIGGFQSNQSDALHDSGGGMEQSRLEMVDLGAADRVINTAIRPPFTSLREFTYHDLGFSEAPAPEVFAAKVNEQFESQPRIVPAEVPVAKLKQKELKSTERASIAATSEVDTALVTRAELAYQLAVTDTSNIYDIILARALVEQVVQVTAETGTWTKRLMDLIRLEQFETRRWQEAHLDSSKAPAND